MGFNSTVWGKERGGERREEKRGRGHGMGEREISGTGRLMNEVGVTFRTRQPFRYTQTKNR